jgi:hypothetical protein
MTVAQVNELPPGCALGEHERSDFERQLLRVTARVRFTKFEPDGDLHIVLEDAGRRMVVESPSVFCTRNSRFRTTLRIARVAAEKLRPGQTVTIEGPAFYDFFHGQLGMAASCVEIHPIMAVRP